MLLPGVSCGTSLVLTEGAAGLVDVDATVETTGWATDGVGTDGAVVDAASRKYWRKESCWTTGLEDEFSPTVASWSAKDVAAADVLAAMVGGSSTAGVVKGLVAVIIGSLTPAKKIAIPGPFRLGV